jgi:site-specific recombinase XerD
MSITNERLVERFRREYQLYHRISAERARQQRRLLIDFGDFIEAPALTGATGDDLQAFAGELLATGLHVNTVRKKLNMLRPFYSWAYAVGLVGGEQYFRLKLVKNPRGATGQSEPKPYTRKELTAFWAKLDETMPLVPERGDRSQAIKRWLRGTGPWRKVWRHAMHLQIEAAVRLALDMGLRRHEIFALGVNDLHYDNEYVVVHGKADPKTGEKKIRQVPFTAEAREAVKSWLEFRALIRPKHDRAWLRLWGPGYDTPMSWERFRKLLTGYVGAGWRWHRFRHTAGTEWLRAGMPLEKVSKLLGHGNIMQTLGYAEILKGDVAADMAKYEPQFAEAVSNRAA